MKKRQFLKSLIAASFLVSGVHLAQADTLSNVEKSGVIRIAVPQDFPPFGSLGSDLKLQGYDIDMANLIAHELKARVELIPVTSTNRIPYLTTGKADLVISSLGKNAEREKVIDFSAPYVPFVKSVFGPEDVKISKPADLAGKVVGVTRGSTEDLALTKLAPSGTVIKRFEDNNATISSYLTGQVQLVTLGNIVANSVNAMTKLRRLSPKMTVEDTPCYVGVAKGETAMQAKVNEIIGKAKKDGRLNQFSLRWLQVPLPAGL